MACSATANEVTVSELKTTFADRLHGVEESLYADAMRQKWFRTRPDNVRTRWAGRGVLLLVAGAALTFVLARWTHLGHRRDPGDRGRASPSP